MMVSLDDALVACSIDLSGLRGRKSRRFQDRDDLHLMQMNGDVAHHLCEASFKAFARAFRQAKARIEGDEIPSTKGLLE